MSDKKAGQWDDTSRRAFIAGFLRGARAGSKYHKNLSAAARRAGIAPSRLHQFERAELLPTAEELRTLCELIYDVDPEFAVGVLD